MTDLKDRLSQREESAKDTLQSLYKAENNSRGSDIAASDPDLVQYTTLKADVRALVTYYVNELTAEHNGGRATQEALKLDHWLVDFEKKYDLDDGYSVPEVPLQKLVELSQHKDRAIHKLLNLIKNSISHEYQSMERNLPDNIAYCSRELPELFHLNQTIKSLVKRSINIELSMAAQGGADILEEKDRVIKSMKEVEIERESKIMDLKQILVAGESDQGRFHMLSRQNDRIQSLEAQLADVKQDMNNIDTQLTLAKQSKGMSADQSIVLRSQVRTLKSNYDRDVAKLRPLLEEQVNRAQDDARDVQLLRNSSIMNETRLISLHKQIHDLKIDLQNTQVSEKAARSDEAVAQEELMRLKIETKKLHRMQNVVITAKMKFHELSQHNETLVKAKEIELKEIKNEMQKALDKVVASEAKVTGLEAARQQAVDHANGLHDQLMRWKAEAASEHIATNVMRVDLEDIRASDTASFREDYYRLEKELKESKEVNDKLDKQLRNAMARIYELQGQLIGDASTVRSETIGDEKDASLEDDERPYTMSKN